MTTSLTSSSPRTRPTVPPGGRAMSGGQRRGEASGVRRVACSRWVRVGLPVTAVLLALAAAAALAFPTLSDWYARHEQHVLAGQLDEPAVGGAAGSGAPIGWITIPAIALHMVVVQGTDAAALAKGPGHYPATPMPCAAGDVAIAGHRTTFLHPFADLNLLAPGDVIELRTRSQSCTYRVARAPFAVSPNDAAVVADTPGHFTLTLTTCHPKGSSRQRLVVKAVMVPGSSEAVRAP